MIAEATLYVWPPEILLDTSRKCGAIGQHNHMGFSYQSGGLNHGKDDSYSR